MLKLGRYWPWKTVSSHLNTESRGSSEMGYSYFMKEPTLMSLRLCSPQTSVGRLSYATSFASGKIIQDIQPLRLEPPLHFYGSPPRTVFTKGTHQEEWSVLSWLPSRMVRDYFQCCTGKARSLKEFLSWNTLIFSTKSTGSTYKRVAIVGAHLKMSLYEYENEQEQSFTPLVSSSPVSLPYP